MDSSWGNWREYQPSSKRVVVGLAVTALTTLGAVMAAMNPGQAAYEKYATQQVIKLLDQGICQEAPKAFNLQRDCQFQLATHRSKIKQFIASNTEHQNFIFFSIYTTDVSVSAFLPSYRVETVGAFRQFHLYDAAQE